MAKSFSIPSNVGPEEAQKFLAKFGAHLSEGEAEQAMREYLTSRVNGNGGGATATVPASKPNGSGFKRNTNPAIPLGSRGPVDMTRLLADVASGKVTAEDAAKMLGKPRHKLYCKVSEKGALSLYGLGQWPVTLYAEQWEALVDVAHELPNVIATQNGSLKRKVAV
jgi:hypothetical protein